MQKFWTNFCRCFKGEFRKRFFAEHPIKLDVDDHRGTTWEPFLLIFDYTDAIIFSPCRILVTQLIAHLSSCRTTPVSWPLVCGCQVAHGQKVDCLSENWCCTEGICCNHLQTKTKHLNFERWSLRPFYQSNLPLK